MRAKSNFIIRLLGKLYYFPLRIQENVEELIKKRHCVIQNNSRLYIQCKINNRQDRTHIQIGICSKLLCRLETYRHGGRILIGDYCFVGENTYIWSASEIKIGNRVLISHDVNIHDTNSHSLSAENRHQHFLDIFQTGAKDILEDVETRPIIIEDDAWIGFGSTILKGVTIGRGAVVAARALVTKDVPPYTVVAGSPARPIGISRR